MTKALIKELKDSGQDYEFYPTTEEMLIPIYEDMRYNRIKTVLDIGCGTCNFKKYAKKWNSTNNNWLDFKYYGVENSKILIDRLDKDVILLGTDFDYMTLIDKKVSAIFCNPPYSRFVEWTTRIIYESNATDIYLVIPQRWKDNQSINDIIRRVRARADVLGSFDFLDAERQARAKVDVVHISKGYGGTNKAFDDWFDETFVPEHKKTEQEDEKIQDKLKRELVTGKNKIEILVNSFEHEQSKLFSNFKAIGNLDNDLLESIGISIDNVKDSLKSKIEGLKCIYWDLVFNELEELTSRLTTESRSKMLGKFNEVNTIDFNHSNIYSLIVFALKNAKAYYGEQLINLYKDLSSENNVAPYKSNQSTFKYDRWRYNATEENAQKYTLDYRIVTVFLKFRDRYSWEDGLDPRTVEKTISDICTISNNLGFEVGEKELATEYNQKNNVYGKNGEVLFEYKTFKNGNTHLKFNKELIKAINVEASRLLGWIRTKEDIKAEFSGDLAKGADKYFRCNSDILITSNEVLLLTEG